MPIQNSISNAIKGSIINGGGPAADFSTKSLFFDGVDEYISTSEVYSELDGESKVTISAWIKVGTGTDTLSYLCSIPGGSAFTIGIRLQTTTDTIAWCYVNGAGNNSRANANLGAIKGDGLWHHLMVCLDLSLPNFQECQIFLDNNLQTMSGYFAGATLPNANDSLYIGNRDAINASHFGGNIDELAIWAGQDLRSSVATIYNNGKPADLTSLNPTSWYRAGENSTFSYPQILMPEDTNKNKLSKYSLDFDGTSDYIDCGDYDEFSFGNGKVDSRFSLSAWIYMNDATDFAIMSKYDTNVEYQFFVTSADRILFRLFSGGTTLNRIGRQTDPITSFENQWIHVAATYDGSSTLAGIKIYLNGNRVDTTDSSLNTYTAMSNTNASFEIGRISAVYANGKIDEAAVFPVELGLSDVQAIYNNGVPTDISSYSPVGYWKLGEEAKFTDNWLVPNSALSNFSKYSFNFDGIDDYISIGTNSLGITNSITVSAWVKIPTTNTGGGGANIQVIACEDTTSGGQRNWNMFWRGTGSNYFAWVIHHTNLTSSSVVTTGITPNDGQWHHLLGTYDGTTNANGIKLYVDGALSVQGTAGSTGINAFSSSEPTIGATTGGGAWKFEGNIDEVAVWDSELSAGAVTAIYNGGKPKDLSGNSPVSWWRMGEEATYDGTSNQFTIPDQGSGGNNGTSSNTMLLETLVGDTPQYYGGGISDSMDIFDRVGDAPVFTNNFSLELDGVDDYVTFGSMTGSSLAITGDISISMWLKFSNSGGTRYAMSMGDQYGIYTSGGTIRGFSRIGGTFTALSSVGTFNDGQWHHVLYVKNSTNMYLYIDGSLNASNTSGGTTTISGLDMRLGARYTNLNWYEGQMDEVAIWNSDQSSIASEIGSSPVDLSTYLPLSWWRFEEGSGTTAKDSGSGGNDGTLSTALGPLYDTDRILTPKANNTVSFNMEEADIVEDTP